MLPEGKKVDTLTFICCVPTIGRKRVNSVQFPHVYMLSSFMLYR